MKKHLLFRVETEIDTLLVVVDWDEDLVNLINARREAAAPLMGMGSFHRATFFWYGLEAYTMPEEIEDLVSYDNGGVLVVDELPELDESTRQRIDCSQMGVGRDDVIFTFYLKHTTQELETATIGVDDETLFPKNAA